MPFPFRKYIAWIYGPFFLLLTMILAGCLTGQGTNFPTPYPTEYLPTVIAMTAAALLPPELSSTPLSDASPMLSVATPDTTPTLAVPTQTVDALQTSGGTPGDAVTPTPTSDQMQVLTPTITRRPSQTPTITLTPEVPVAAIQIFAPGPMSKLLSPMRVSTRVKLGPTYKVTIELLGEDGRLLLRVVRPYTEEFAPYVNPLEELDFEIPSVAEKGRLVISTHDTFGRIVSLASVDVLLLSIGEDDVNPYGDFLETIVIQQPLPSSLIQGGKLTVAGQARLERGEVLIELTDAQGKLVGYQMAPLNASEGQLTGYGAFSVEVPYLVDAPTWVRLSVSQSGERPGGLTHLSSLEVLVSP